MAKQQKIFRPKPRIPNGLRDMYGDELNLQSYIVETISEIYKIYGFSILDTPTLEYADTIGKFLPDDDRPNDGVFSLQDDDTQWLSMRYDLTAPLARFVAEHYETLPKPFRRYQSGLVYRNEKAGIGRFRQFLQIDADTIGASGQHADTEMCLLASDAMEALGLSGQYIIRINNRKILDGILETIGLDPQTPHYQTTRLIILRAIDKYDRLGSTGVEALLGAGRKDESGDFTKGAQLSPHSISKIMAFVTAGHPHRQAVLTQLTSLVGKSHIGQKGIEELKTMDHLLTQADYDETCIIFDPSIIRGLDYYTGPVFEIDLTFTTHSTTGDVIRFGAIGGGGRYDDLIKRFKGIEIPSTGISIGVSRLASALNHLGKIQNTITHPLIIILVMDKDKLTDYLQMTQNLRKEGICAETYMGEGGMKAQIRYADKRRATYVIIEGEEERSQGVVTLKDLALGKEQSTHIKDNAEWRASAHAQQQIKKSELVTKIKDILGHKT